MSDNPVEGPVGTPPQAGTGAPRRAFDEEKKFPRGLVIRLIAYLVAGHLFAGFLFLLFEVGAHH